MHAQSQIMKSWRHSLDINKKDNQKTQRKLVQGQQ